MITWGEFIGTDRKESPKYETTNIACPKCGKPIWKNVGFVLASYPEKHQYLCFNCGWTGVH